MAIKQFWALPLLLALGTSALGNEACVLEHCHDGDTCTVICGKGSDVQRKIRVRFSCIDAPEMAQAAWGKMSRDNLGQMLHRGDRIDLQVVDTDRYGRTVGMLFKNGFNLNLEQVKSGAAAVYDRYCRDTAFFAAQAEAKITKRGIWSEPGMQQTPWNFRKEQQ